MTAKTDRRKISSHERRIAMELGGRKTFASGSGDEKGDGVVVRQFVRTADGITVSPRIAIRIESKITNKDFYRLTSIDWEKLATAAEQRGEEPLFHIQLTVPGLHRIELAVIRRGLARDLKIHPEDPGPAPALSYRVSWDRWRGGPPAEVLLKQLFSPDIHCLTLASYYDVKNRLSEIQ